MPPPSRDRFEELERRIATSLSQVLRELLPRLAEDLEAAGERTAYHRDRQAIFTAAALLRIDPEARARRAQEALFERVDRFRGLAATATRREDALRLVEDEELESQLLVSDLASHTLDAAGRTAPVFDARVAALLDEHWDGEPVNPLGPHGLARAVCAVLPDVMRAGAARSAVRTALRSRLPEALASVIAQADAWLDAEGVAPREPPAEEGAPSPAETPADATAVAREPADESVGAPASPPGAPPVRDDTAASLAREPSASDREAAPAPAPAVPAPPDADATAAAAAVLQGAGAPVDVSGGLPAVEETTGAAPLDATTPATPPAATETATDETADRLAAPATSAVEAADTLGASPIASASSPHRLRTLPTLQPVADIERDAVAFAHAVDVSPYSRDARRAFFENVRQRVAQAGATSAQLATVDIVAAMFDYVVDDRRLPEGAKPLMWRLQPPAVALSLLDPGYLGDEPRSLRRLVEHLGAISTAFGEELVRGHELHRRIETVVRAVEIVASVLQTRSAVMSRQVEVEYARAARSVTQLIDRVVNERKQLESVPGRRNRRDYGRRPGPEKEREVTERLNQLLLDRLQSHDVPESVRDFLLTVWLRHLRTAALRDGEDSTEFQVALQVVDDLLWSLDAGKVKQSRRELAMKIPPLIRVLTHGLREIGAKQDDYKPFFDELFLIHLRKMQPRSRTGDTEASPQPAGGGRTLAAAGAAAGVEPRIPGDMPATDVHDVPTMPVAEALDITLPLLDDTVPQATPGDAEEPAQAPSSDAPGAAPRGPVALHWPSIDLGLGSERRAAPPPQRDAAGGVAPEPAVAAGSDVAQPPVSRRTDAPPEVPEGPASGAAAASPASTEAAPATGVPTTVPERAASEVAPSPAAEVATPAVAPSPARAAWERAVAAESGSAPSEEAPATPAATAGDIPAAAVEPLPTEIPARGVPGLRRRAEPPSTPATPVIEPPEPPEKKLLQVLDSLDLHDFPEAARPRGLGPEETVAELARGDWLELVSRAGERGFAKVAWINARRTVVLLVRYPDRRALSMRTGELRDRLVQGRARLLDHEQG